MDLVLTVKGQRRIRARVYRYAGRAVSVERNIRILDRDIRFRVLFFLVLFDRDKRAVINFGFYAVNRHINRCCIARDADLAGRFSIGVFFDRLCFSIGDLDCPLRDVQFVIDFAGFIGMLIFTADPFVLVRFFLVMEIGLAVILRLTAPYASVLVGSDLDITVI